MNCKRAEFFDRYARGWDASEPPDMPDRLKRVAREADVRPGMRVLDVGTGTGVLIPYLLEALSGNGSVLAIDISREMLEQARAKGFPETVEFRLTAMEDFDPHGKAFDRVVCNAVFPHFWDRRLALQKAFSALKPGGIVVISHPKGREAVNRIHREAGDAVSGDRVPDPETMRALLVETGFTGVTVIDEPEFYLARAVRP